DDRPAATGTPCLPRSPRALTRGFRDQAPWRSPASSTYNRALAARSVVTLTRCAGSRHLLGSLWWNPSRSTTLTGAHAVPWRGRARVVQRDRRRARRLRPDRRPPLPPAPVRGRAARRRPQVPQVGRVCELVPAAALRPWVR